MMFLSDQSVKYFSGSSSSSKHDTSAPQLGIAGIEILAKHEFADDVLIQGNSSYSVGNTRNKVHQWTNNIPLLGLYEWTISIAILLCYFG